MSETVYGGYQITVQDMEYQVAATGLSLYSRNAPFEEQKWTLLAFVPTNTLFEFSRSVKVIINSAAAFMLVVGIIAAFIISTHIAHPIANLRKELAKA